MTKKKGSFTLIEALNILSDATTSRGYPDNGTGVSTDDDRPPGNIVYGEKYKRTSYFNRLTDYQDSWELDDGDWTWDEFDNSGGMEDINNYSNTLKSMKDMFPKKTWNNIMKRMKYVSKAKATADFKKSGQIHRKGGEDQIGYDKNPHVDVKMKGSKIKKSDIKEKIDLFTK